MERIIILSKVVDNFGDAGFCVRLARALLEINPALFIVFVSDESTLVRALFGSIPKNLTLVDWTSGFVLDPTTLKKNASYKVDESPVVLECFECGRPLWLEERLFDGRKSHIVAIDYLTAEPYAEKFHKLASITRSPLVTKVFFMPGWTAGTGGLILSSTKMITKDKTFLRNRSRVFFFSYTHNIRPVIEEIERHGFLVDSLFGAGQIAIQAALKECKADMGAPIREWPFLTQEKFDRLLSRADVAFVRGEDSVNRAALMGVPFVWQAYPQSDDYQIVKVSALLDIMEKYFPISDFSIVKRLFLLYNCPTADEKDLAHAVGDFLEGRDRLRPSYKDFSRFLKSNGDFASHLLNYVESQFFK